MGQTNNKINSILPRGHSNKESCAMATPRIFVAMASNINPSLGFIWKKTRKKILVVERSS